MKAFSRIVAFALLVSATGIMSADITPEAILASARNVAWKPLFNGKDLDNWVKRGGNAPFTVEGDEIVGTFVPKTANTFLCTGRNYGDFILELEFNAHPDVNSGVQIRSDDAPGERILEGYPPLAGKKPAKKIRIQGNHVSGYQVEIEPRHGRTAGLYDENRRNGWAYPTPDIAKDYVKKIRSIEKPGTWQKLRVEAAGDTIRTYLDDVLCADLTENLPTKTGFIALQVHSSSQRDAGKKIRFRNIRIKDLDKK
ncbi:MAG: DUF1080 domain-containing protein [Puniceicoccales bacterium]|jgi:hypothetical protein|nr:DUF1080 domain-containing protein [Puniceicoccales bacterium]